MHIEIEILEFKMAVGIWVSLLEYADGSPKSLGKGNDDPESQRKEIIRHVHGKNHSIYGVARPQDWLVDYALDRGQDSSGVLWKPYD